MGSQFLPIRKPPQIIFSISRLRDEFIYLKDPLLEINSTWLDVQTLNNFSNCIIGRLVDEKEDIFECLFSGLEVIIKDFYIHFSIVYKLLEKVCKNSKNIILKNYFKEFDKKFGKNAQILRNEVIIHKEKNNFRKIHLSTFDTSCGGLFLKLITKKGNFELKPFIDAKIIEDQLLNFKKLIEK